MKSPAIKSLVVAAFVMAHGPIRAEDIDLFTGSPAGANDLPNVLFIIDNTANWTTAFSNEVAALQATFANLPANADQSPRFNIGVMFAAETSSSDSNVSGGYVRAALRPMTGENKAKYAAMIGALDVGKDKGNGGASSLVMAEAYRYFSGGTPYAGNNKAKTDYRGNTGADWSSSATTAASLAAMRDIYDLPGNALNSKGDTTYRWPSESSCGRNYIIYISNGPAQDNNTYMSQSNALLAAAGGDIAPIPLSPTGSQSNVSDEWARFMKQGLLGVTTYTIDVNPSTTGQGPGWSKLLRSMAEGVGGGKYVAVNSSADGGAEISTAVNKALSEVQAVNSVFASVSLPVSANPQGSYSNGTYANQVYIGMFRPDAGAYPRWTGNLKQYRLGYVNSILRLVDADANSAVNSLTGFITECARSFWTPSIDATDDYWTFRPAGECIPPTGSDPNLYRNSNTPDGNIVEKGAQAYRLRSDTARTLKTCSPTSCTTLADFATTNTDITEASLGAASGAERTALINWARGLDIDDENGDTQTTTMRASAHGDVVHSRPVAINFGTTSAPEVVAFYGGNDGILRAVNGNQTEYIGSVAPGAELWAFMPPQFYGQIKRLRDNTTQISFPNITTPGAQPKPYGVDGPITAHQASTSDTWIYATMRRGGRALYAFNVPNSNPGNITLKWTVGCIDATCSSGFGDIGQTWAAAKVLKTAHDSGAAPLLIMGGGYDTCEDTDPNDCTSSSQGSQIYVLNADTGALLNTLETDRGVIADVVVVPDSTTGLTKLAYAADLGGNIYRINIGSDAPADWTITKIASLGCSTAATCSTNRKFMFAPDVVEDNGDYVLLLGSGDREKPLLSYSAAAGVTNYFFMLRDRPLDSGWLQTELTTCGAALICLDSLVAITSAADPSDTDLAAKKGWALRLRSTEQVVTSAITVFGVVSFSSHAPDVPQPGTCTSRLGTARVYNVSYQDAATQNGTFDRSQELPPDIGLPPSPVAGMVNMNGESIAFCIGCGPTSSIEVEDVEVPPSMVPGQPKGRVYWYIQR
jgi:type IV pilus assembly protein PilY1